MRCYAANRIPHGPSPLGKPVRGRQDHACRPGLACPSGRIRLVVELPRSTRPGRFPGKEMAMTTSTVTDLAAAPGTGDLRDGAADSAERAALLLCLNKQREHVVGVLEGLAEQAL